MTVSALYDLLREAMWTATLLAAPALLAMLLVGLVVSLLQALTQVQEMTLTLLPKLLALVGTLALAAPWMWALLIAFGERTFARIALVGG